MKRYTLLDRLIYWGMWLVLLATLVIGFSKGAFAQQTHPCQNVYCKPGKFLGLIVSGTTSSTYFVGDGSQLTNVAGGLAASPSTPQGGIQYNSGGNFSANGNFRYVTATGVVSVTGTVSATEGDFSNVSASTLSAGLITGSAYSGNASSMTVVATGAALAKTIADAISDYGVQEFVSESGVISDGNSHAQNLPIAYAVFAKTPAAGWAEVHLPHNTKWGTNRAVGAVTYITLTTAGTGYSSAPVATISDSATTSGTTCTGQVVGVTLSGGQVSAVSMTTVGSGCTKDNPQVLFSGGGGSGAAAVAYIEHPLRHHSRMKIDLEGTQFHNLNSPEQALFEGESFQDSSINSSTFVVYDFGVRGLIEYTSSSVGQGKKGLIMSNTKNAVTLYERVSGTTIGSFNSQCRNCYNYFRLFPQQGAGDSQGEDRFHVTGDSQWVFTVVGNDTGGDDCGSVTQETSGHAGKTAAHIYWYGGHCGSFANSSSKLECSTPNARITDVGFIGTHFDVVGDGTDGGVLKWDSEDCPIDHVWLRDVVADASNGQPSPGGPSMQLTSLKPCGLSYVDMGNLQLRGAKFHGIEIDGNVCHVKGDNATFSEYAGESILQTGISLTGVSRFAANSIRFDIVSGSLTVTNTSNLYISPTGFLKTFNNNIMAVTSLTSTYILATATNVSTSVAESSTVATATLMADPGAYIYQRGGYDINWKGLTIDGGPGIGVQLLTDGGKTYTLLAPQYAGEDTLRLSVSGTTSNIQQESPYAGYITVTGFANGINNPTNAKIMLVDASNKYFYVRVPNITSATDETGATASGGTVYIPTNTDLVGTTCINQDRGTCLVISAGMSTLVADTHCKDSRGDKCISEAGTGTVSDTLAYGNIDDGETWNGTRGGSTFSDPDHRDIFLNRSALGPDWFTRVNLITVSASAIKAISGTFIGVSSTNISVTGVGSFGTISVSAFTTPISKTVCAGPAGLFISPTC